MTLEKISPGQLVQSITGRDKGQIYLIVGFETATRVLLADGRNRKAATPKRKNIRHIRRLKALEEEVAVKIASGLMVTDEEIRRAIRGCTGIGEQ